MDECCQATRQRLNVESGLCWIGGAQQRHHFRIGVESRKQRAFSAMHAHLGRVLTKYGNADLILQRLQFGVRPVECRHPRKIGQTRHVAQTRLSVHADMDHFAVGERLVLLVNFRQAEIPMPVLAANE